MSDQRPSGMDGWWTISADELYEMLQRVEAGERAALVYAEAYASSRRSRPSDTDDV